MLSSMEGDLLDELERRRQITRRESPRIQRVAHYLRNRPDYEKKYYSPKVVSLGPIHHGKRHLELGEHYKLNWTSMYVNGDRNEAQRLYGEIVANIKELKALYTDDAIGQFEDCKLARMLFLDGCALLQIIRSPDISEVSETLEAKDDLLALVHHDALLLENQLPFRVLQLLSSRVLTDSVHGLLNVMDNFLNFHHLAPRRPRQDRADRGGDRQHVIETTRPAHLLDRLWRNVAAEFQPAQGNQRQTRTGHEITHRNLKELKESGIKVKRNQSATTPIDITFSPCWLCGELKFPRIIVDDNSAAKYLNLMAYEACPDFQNKYEISSYVCFLDSLIDHPDDVKELRRAGVLVNALGSDDKVAELFNDISTDVVPNPKIYGALRVKIEEHFQDKIKTWLYVGYSNHFSNPWSITAFLAAFVALLLTFIQTWFTLFPRG